MKKTMNECMLLAMQKVQEVQKVNGLLYPSRFEVTKSVDIVTQNIYTNNPFFDIQIDTNGLNGMIYRLKENASAANAIESVLAGEHYMVIDCKLSIVICQWYALLLYMRDQLGENEGNHRFDALFGASNEVIPVYRRLIICDPLSAYNLALDSTGMDATFNPYPTPLCFFIQNEDKQKDLGLLPIGTAFYVENYPDYQKKHPRTRIDTRFPSMFKGQWCLLKDAETQQIACFSEQPIETLPQLEQLLCDRFNEPSVDATGNYPLITRSNLPMQVQILEFRDKTAFYCTHASLAAAKAMIEIRMRTSILSFERRKLPVLPDTPPQPIVHAFKAPPEPPKSTPEPSFGWMRKGFFR